MNKLIIAVCTVALAVVSNASQCVWGTDYAEYKDESEISSGTYWVLALGSSSDTSAITVSDGGVIGGLDKGQSVAMSGQIVGADTIGGVLGSVTSADNGKYYALLLWDGLDSKDGGMFGISDAVAMSGVVDAPPTDGKYMDFFNGHDSAGNATFLDQNVIGGGPGPVPEPTSGLLLLIGVVGMALRRRRV